MREPRNPFRLRASEAIESDTTFLKLFGPRYAHLLPEGTQLWSINFPQRAGPEKAPFCVCLRRACY